MHFCAVRVIRDGNEPARVARFEDFPKHGNGYRRESWEIYHAVIIGRRKLGLISFIKRDAREANDLTWYIMTYIGGRKSVLNKIDSLGSYIRAVQN